jgi:hypothetical protein
MAGTVPIVIAGFVATGRKLPGVNSRALGFRVNSRALGFNVKGFGGEGANAEASSTEGGGIL